MSSLAPLGPVYQAGTLSGNPLATAAGTTVLNLVTPHDYEDLAQARRCLRVRIWKSAITSSGLVRTVSQRGTADGSVSLARAVRGADAILIEAKALCENGLYPAFFHAMLERGVALAPGAYEILFVSLAHSDDDLATTVEKAAEAAKVVARS